MRSEYTAYKLSDLCDIGSSKRIFQHEYVKDGIPFFRSKEVIDKALGSFEQNELLYISYAKFAEIKSKYNVPKAGELLLSSVGNRSGIPYVVKETDGDFYFKDGNLTWFRNFKNLDSVFLYFWINSQTGQNSLNAIMIGSAQKALTISGLQSLTITIPPLPTQKKIAHILSTLDDKIELNRKMNQTLEEMAQAIFKSWFVDFDPVHVKMACGNEKELQQAAKKLGISKEILDLFPNEFEESELGMIPNGWEWKSFGDVLIPKKGKNITKDTVTDGSVPVVAGGLTPAYYHSEYNAKAPVITVSASGANAGHVNLYTQNIWASDCSYINEGMTKFVYSMYLFLKENQKEITRMQQGAAQPHVYPKDLMRLLIANPDIHLWNLLETNIKPMFEKIGNNEREIKTLQKTRDTLLPKLLSGELDVSEFELDLE